MLKRCIYVLCLVVIVFLSGSIGNNDYIWADTPETYEYVRMWPTLKNPWYFNEPHGIAVDNSSNVYVADSDNEQIQKFTIDGQFITKWGTGGSGDGQFYSPRAIAVDGNNNVFIVDTYNNRIQKFTSDGTFISKWGSYGTGNGNFENPLGLAVDSAGNVYVADSDNNRIQKFTSNGTFISKWGSTGTGASQFNSPRGVAVDNAGNVYVADFGNNRIQKFTKDGTFIMQWGQSGSADGQFYSPYGLASDKSGNLYVADSGIVDTTSVPGRITVTGGNHRIQKFTSDGKFITKWGSWGDLDGRFKLPDGVAIDSSGNVFVVESFGARIQRFTSDGVFVAKWACKGAGDITGSDPGGFSNPGGIAFDKDGNVYIADSWYGRIQKFTPDGQFLKMWGSWGTGDGQMEVPVHLQVDGSNNIYVGDCLNNRIQKFTGDGVFIKKWGSQGDGAGQFNGCPTFAMDKNNIIFVTDGYKIQRFNSDGQFIDKWGNYGSGNDTLNNPGMIAIDQNGNVYVYDNTKSIIQKFASNGSFITSWGGNGTENGKFNGPQGIFADSDGYVYVADTANYRVQKFTTDGKFILSLGNNGTNPGQLRWPIQMNVSKDGYLYVSEVFNYRVQVFKKATSTSNQKAIIVAGSGPYQGNNLWNATEMNANFAYRALTYQGFKKENIYYLSFANIDVDNNGLLDDVANSPSNDNFKYAITSWAKDAGDVIIYLTGHGGDGTFRMSDSDILKASDLSAWLNTLQTNITGKVIFVYDACYSGSFISQLVPPAGKPRIDITSTSPTEEAVFGSGGSVSFSYYFWGSVFNGYKLYDSYVNAKNSIKLTYDKQNALIDDDGDGVGGEKTDGNVAKNVTIGNGNSFAADFPVIGSVSPAQTLNGGTTAKIRADNVTSTGSIQRVWAVVTPPDFKPATSGEPVTNLPTFDFNSVGGNAYEGTYGSFAVKGTYNIAVFAVDDKGTLSIPQATSVTQSNGSLTNIDPQPAITVNGSTGTVNQKTSDNLSLKISLNPGSHTNENADWWLYVTSTLGNYYFDVKGGKGWTAGNAVTYQGALFNLQPAELLNITGLPVGSYTFNFQVDLTPNGVLDGKIYSGSVTVNVNQSVTSCSPDGNYSGTNTTGKDGAISFTVSNNTMTSLLTIIDDSCGYVDTANTASSTSIPITNCSFTYTGKGTFSVGTDTGTYTRTVSGTFSNGTASGSITYSDSMPCTASGTWTAHK
ncbi:MAG: hypothetical protein HQK89_07275 [Nitrospirae bacterium]|nr:hypothetical protein [Nitrospirota bacterium]